MCLSRVHILGSGCFQSKSLTGVGQILKWQRVRAERPAGASEAEMRGDACLQQGSWSQGHRQQCGKQDCAARHSVLPPDTWKHSWKVLSVFFQLLLIKHKRYTFLVLKTLSSFLRNRGNRSNFRFAGLENKTFSHTLSQQKARKKFCTT